MAALLLGLLLLGRSGLGCVEAHASDEQHEADAPCIACVCTCQRAWVDPQVQVAVQPPQATAQFLISPDDTRPHAACLHGIDHPPKF